MRSSPVLPTIISLLLTLNLCSADVPAAPSGPSSPSGGKLGNPPGYPCAFQPPSGCGLDPSDTTSPAYNGCLVRDYSVTEFIQCANETSTIGGSDDSSSSPLNALNVLVSATKIPACNKCTAGAVFADYQSMKDKSVTLARYLCNKVDNGDICCLSNCLGTMHVENNLDGICKNDNVNLYGNGPNYCGSDSGDAAAASSSATTATKGSKPTVTPSPSSNVAAHTTSPTQTVAPSTSSNAATLTPSPTQTPSSSPARSSSPSASSKIRAANIVALGLLVVILTTAV